jgi:hypothetical protein
MAKKIFRGQTRYKKAKIELFDLKKANIPTLPRGDLKTRERTGTSCQIEIHFSIKTT